MMLPTFSSCSGSSRRVSRSGSENRPTIRLAPINDRLKVVAGCALVAIACCLSACSDDDDGPVGPDYNFDDDPDASVPIDAADTGPDATSEPDSTFPDSAPDAQSPDTRNPDVPPPLTCGGVECDDGQVCHEDTCKTPAEARCDDIENSGSLSIGSSLTLTGDFPIQTTSVLQTNCNPIEEAQERIFRFTVPSDSQISTSIDESAGLDTRIEFRRGGCAPGEDSTIQDQICTDTDSSFFAPAGSTWYAVVENFTGEEGSFTLDLQAEQSCSFGGVGTITCSGESVAICEDVDDTPTETFRDCPDACSDGECVGDSCQNPITYSVGSNFSQTFSGDLVAFSPQINLESESSCRVNGQQFNAQGVEVVFKLTGVQAGQTITVETSNDATGDINSNVVYISNNCPQQNSQFVCAATWDELDSQNSATVDTAGDYYVIVDKGSSSVNPFTYRISVE